MGSHINKLNENRDEPNIGISQNKLTTRFKNFKTKRNNHITIITNASSKLHKSKIIRESKFQTNTTGSTNNADNTDQHTNQRTETRDPGSN